MTWLIQLFQVQYGLKAQSKLYVTLTNATHSGRVLLVPDGGQDNTYTLPAPIAGSMFRFVYAGGAADATDAIIVTPGNTNFYIGGVTFLDTDGNVTSTTAPAFADQ